MDGWILDTLDIKNLECLWEFERCTPEHHRIWSILEVPSTCLSLTQLLYFPEVSQLFVQTSWNCNAGHSVYPIPFEKQQLHSRNESNLQVTAEFWRSSGKSWDFTSGLCTAGTRGSIASTSCSPQMLSVELSFWTNGWRRVDEWVGVWLEEKEGGKDILKPRGKM